jgi:HEAT repeat protein
MIIVTDAAGVEYSAPIEVITPDSTLPEERRDLIKLKPRKNPLRPFKIDPDKTHTLIVFKGQERRLQSEQRVTRVDDFDSTVINVGTPNVRMLSVKGLALGKTSMKVGLQNREMDKFDRECTIDVEVKEMSRELMRDLFVADEKTTAHTSKDHNDKPKPADPEALLDQFAVGALPSLWLMTGGGFFENGETPSTIHVVHWTNQHSNENEFDPRVRNLIALGESAAPHINKRLKALLPSDEMTPHLVLALRAVGNSESVPTLIGLLEKMPGEPEIGGAGPGSITRLAATSALWKQTGRKQIFSPKQWQAWWKSVESDFVPERDRDRLDVQVRVTADRVDRLVNELSRDEVAARERLVVLGSAALPYLLELFDAKSPDRLDDSTPQKDKQSLVRLAWVIDELGGTAKLPQRLRREYFTQRFSSVKNVVAIFPIEEDAACRAMIHCSYADFCKICLAVDREMGNQQMYWMTSWLSMNRDLVIRRLGSTVRSFGRRGLSRLPYWNQFLPARPDHDEIAEAAPVMIEALKSSDIQIRSSAATLADITGSCSSEKPSELIVAMRDAWLNETDSGVRSAIGNAMARFGTPLVIQTFCDGLQSDRLEIVSESAGLIDWVPIQRTEATQVVFDRLLELTHHENDRLRYRAVRSLRGKAPSMLGTEFDRLVTDKMVDIRKECALALRSDPDPKYADILFKLLEDVDEQARIEALSSIANLKHVPSMKRLLPYLHDKKIHGWAVSALARMGGPDAVPLLIGELQSGNDVDGMIYQHLVQITHENLDAKPEPWIAWWRKQRLLRADEKRKASDGQKDK